MGQLSQNFRKKYFPLKRLVGRPFLLNKLYVRALRCTSHKQCPLTGYFSPPAESPPRPPLWVGRGPCPPRGQARCLPGWKCRSSARWRRLWL